MIALWTSWWKLLVAASLVIGCNSFAPGLATASIPATAMDSGNCHQTEKQDGGAVMTVCKASCLAIAPDVVAVSAQILPQTSYHAHPFDLLTVLARAPDTPPPRDRFDVKIG